MFTDLTSVRTAHNGFADLGTAICFGSTSLKPCKMELANLWVKKSVNISQEKLGSRVVQIKTIERFQVHIKKI